MKTVAKDAIIYGLGSVLNRAIGFLLIPLYTSHLEIAEYGMLGILGTILQLLSFLGLLGVSSAALRFYYDVGSTSESQQNLYAVATTLLIIWPILLFFSISILSFVYPYNTAWGIPVWPVLLLICGAAAVAPLVSLVNGLLRAQRKPVAFVIFNLSFFTIQAATIVFFVANEKLGIHGQVLGQAVAHSIAFVAALFILRSYSKFKFDLSIVKKLFAFGIPLVPFFVFLWLNTSLGRFVIQDSLNLEKVGIFFLASQFGGILSLIGVSLNNALTPHFYSEANKPGSNQVLGRFVAQYLVAFAFFGLVLFVSTPVLLRFWVSGVYLDSISYIGPMLIANLLYVYTFPIHWCLTYAKKTWTLSAIRVMTTILLCLILLCLSAFEAVTLGTVIYSMIGCNFLMAVAGSVYALRAMTLSVRWNVVFRCFGLLSLAALASLILESSEVDGWQTTLLSTCFVCSAGFFCWKLLYVRAKLA